MREVTNKSSNVMQLVLYKISLCDCNAIHFRQACRMNSVCNEVTVPDRVRQIPQSFPMKCMPSMPSVLRVGSKISKAVKRRRFSFRRVTFYAKRAARSDGVRGSRPEKTP